MGPKSTEIKVDFQPLHSDDIKHSILRAFADSLKYLHEMPIIDFTEIPLASTKGAGRDQFELFTREFLNLEGFKIIEAPDWGPGVGDPADEDVAGGVHAVFVSVPEHGVKRTLLTN